ncbi:putative glutamine transport system permease protein [Streptococcus pneumoniae]|nr:putative glutamine transport system permease protein [Streptococcus pneumoniae]
MIDWLLLILILEEDFVSIIYYFKFIYPNHSYLSQLDVTYKTPDLMSHFLPPHEVSFLSFCVFFYTYTIKGKLFFV